MCCILYNILSKNRYQNMICYIDWIFRIFMRSHYWGQPSTRSKNLALGMKRTSYMHNQYFPRKGAHALLLVILTVVHGRLTDVVALHNSSTVTQPIGSGVKFRSPLNDCPAQPERFE